jgi:hypothetical protein
MMDQDTYQKFRQIEFERLEMLIPVGIGIFGLILMGMVWLFQNNIMAFKACLGLMIVCLLYKIAMFFLDLWEYSDYEKYDDMP